MEVDVLLSKKITGFRENILEIGHGRQPTSTGVDCLPYGERAEQSRRPAARDTGHAHPSDSPSRRRPRAPDRETHSTHDRRPAPGRTRVPVPGAASARTQTLDRQQMGDTGGWTTARIQVLPADRSREKAADRGRIEVASTD